MENAHYERTLIAVFFLSAPKSNFNTIFPQTL